MQNCAADFNIIVFLLFELQVGLLPLLFFMTLVPDLNKMAKFSICAQISNLIAFLVVFWFDFEHLHLFQAIKDRDEINVAGLAGFFSVAIYCYEVRFLLLFA